MENVLGKSDKIKKTEKKTIAVIVSWFGPLPPYFPGWLKSAEANETIDFHMVTDQEIVCEKNNIIVHPTTLEKEIKKYSSILKRNITIDNAYKFCDCRLFFGILYRDMLRDYDFWGYCDIDLMFGDIRAFVTDEVLERYDRIYPYGHLCLYRNNEKMNHLYDLPGGIYSYWEIFAGKAKTTPEEYFGANRICRKNRIAWYTETDFADMNVLYPHRLEQVHGKMNHPVQIFLWEDGKAYRVYKNKNCVEREELVYIHWQKKKPVVWEPETFADASHIVISADALIPVSAEALVHPDFERWNPATSEKQKKRLRRSYYRGAMYKFLRAPWQTKRIWMRQMLYRICGEGN
jgi:hypothetical protein